jgi:preprotein translocase subunit SecF
MSDQRLTEEDVERVSKRVASRLLRYAVIGLIVWFVVLPLVLMFIFGVFTFSGR